jgi:glyoxylase-like metal-dependent hydrolase (beta-lactamase superfamily II)
VQTALLNARFIVVTHEHGDHVAGVVRTPDFDALAPKTILTRTQIDTLLNNPQMPEIRLTPEKAKRFIVLDYDKYYPVAPGMALIRAPGHTPGSQMIYVVLRSGREYLFAGDVAWHMDGVRQNKGKNAPWIKEGEAILPELAWLHRLDATEKNLTIVISHDEDQRRADIARGLLGDGLDLKPRR